MDPSITYTNHVGESVEMRVDGTWHYGETDLHDYEWGYDTVNDHVAGFRREPRDFSLRVMMDGGTAAERNRAADVFERDVADGVPGTLRVGLSRMRCWVIASAKDSWWFSEGTMAMDLTVHADDPVWTRETTAQFLRQSPDPSSSGGLDYPHDYPHDYAAPHVSSTIDNPYALPCACRITVYGPAVNPYVIIAGNRYQVDVTVPDGGLLVIDGRERAIVSRTPDGTDLNAFAEGVRGEGARPFARIPPGASEVRWGGAFGFDCAMIEERSEPAW